MHPKMLSRYAAGRGMTETAALAEVETTIQAVASSFRGFRFGSYEADDISQEVAYECLKALSHDPDGGATYDPARPLANFLFVHAKRRLHNLKRDTWMRPEAPCSCCDPFLPPPEPCAHWHRWNRRNAAKQCLARAGSAPAAEPAGRASPAAAELVAEIDAFVDDTLPTEVRSDYLRMKEGVALPKPRRAAVRTAILARFGEAA